MPFIEVQEGLRIQVLPDMSFLPRCQKHQFAAFIADRGVLVVWDDDPKKILGRIERFETALMKMIWGNQSAYPEEDEKKEDVEAEVQEEECDPEKPGESKPRKVMLLQALITAFTICMTIVVIGAGWREITIELMTDHNWMRLAFILAFVPQFWLALVSSILNFRSRSSSNHVPVLLSSSLHQRRSVYWTRQPSAQQYKILFRQTTKTFGQRERGASPCDHPMSCLQGRPLVSH
jgi:hypothetical protein